MAAGATYSPIATTTLGSAASTIDFTSISASYTDLILIMNPIGTAATPQDLRLRFNSDTASNYSRTLLTGNGTAASSSRQTSQTYLFLTGSTGIYTNRGSFITHIFNYANATTYKTILQRSDNAAYGTDAIVGLWKKTPEAITSISLSLSSGNFDTGTVATLYGIVAA